MRRLTVGHEVGADAVIVRAAGDVDISTVQILVEQLTEGLQLASTHPGQLLVLDLENVTYFGSAGLNAALECTEQGRAAGTTVRLVANNARVLRPLQVTNLDSVLEIHPTLEKALLPEDPEPQP
ncbi:STAS domain-containing protein [Nocardia sp. CDC159]|uniref:Anti-sigma factor antagonist n=1 Tax=Nocardia pulmonis TaxID=2951408 RepID=A0A9X2E6B5_9NOCA|nr:MULTISPECIES: STAS domain-containing protein [Nocardia]MCM6775049.1 STAS domain-containing protein [Nocardia pulmonis]MCM6789519.1 STAS domain-containing protein [Nocardia sp. CDC159]